MELDLEGASELLFAEMQDLLQEDNARFPPPGAKKGGKGKRPDLAPCSQEDFDLAEAELLYEQEQLKQAGDVEWAMGNPLIFVPDKKEGGTWVNRTEVHPENLLVALQREWGRLHQRYESEAKRMSKLEKKLSITLGGYANRAQQAVQKVPELHQEYLELRSELAAFKHLETVEKAHTTRRAAELESYQNVVRKRNAEVHAKYKVLEEQRRKLEAALD